jgi:endo-1,4-beta-xylanase
MKNLTLNNFLFTIFFPVIFAFVSFSCQIINMKGFKDTQPVNNVNGFRGEPGAYKIINFEGRRDVIRVNGAATDWLVVQYGLDDYKGQEINIQLSADVKRVGAAGSLNWQVNNNGEWPSVAYLGNASEGVWHHISGMAVLTPIDDNPVLYLTNWENNKMKTIYYIANPVVTISFGNAMSPDLTLPSLKSVYEQDFLIGSIFNGRYQSGKYFDLLKHHFNIVTSTDTYPFVLAHSGKGIYDWTRADTNINFAGSHNIQAHGHVLVWHEENPAWFTKGTRKEIIANMEQYITDVLSHFQGRISSWDVVNEAFKDDISDADLAKGWRNCIRTRQNPWYSALGADYVEIAFRAARKADTDITLYYNDYFHYEWTRDGWAGGQNKVRAVREMIEDINTGYKNETGGTRNLIEGVGSQSHFFNWDIIFDNVRSTLETFKSLGIKIAISELDISNAGLIHEEWKDTPMTAQDQQKQAEMYAKLFSLYREYAPYISRVTFWGIDDGTSWISTGNPLLFDRMLNAKKAYHAVSNPDSFLSQ